MKCQDLGDHGEDLVGEEEVEVGAGLVQAHMALAGSAVAADGVQD